MQVPSTTRTRTSRDPCWVTPLTNHPASHGGCRPNMLTPQPSRLDSDMLIVNIAPGAEEARARLSIGTHDDEEESMSGANVWTVSITFSEDDDRTRADADLEGAPVRLSGFGTSRRNPVAPNLPAVGEEIAAARALGDLSHHLLEQAAHQIESWEGHPVQLDG